MSLAPFNQFPSVKPRFSRGFRGPFDRLTVDNPGARMGVSSHFLAEFLANRGIDFLQNTAIYPLMMVVADQGIRGKAFRQIPPLAAGFIQVKNSIDHLPKIDFSRPAGRIRIRLLQDRFDDLPFLIGEIARVAVIGFFFGPSHASPRIELLQVK